MVEATMTIRRDEWILQGIYDDRLPCYVRRAVLGACDSAPLTYLFRLVSSAVIRGDGAKSLAL